MSDIATLEEFQERALDGIGRALEDAAAARAKSEEMDERRKQVKAAMIVHFRDEGNSIAESEARAMDSKAYKDAASEWIAANYDARTTDARAESRKLAFEAWRTMNATRRAEMSLR